MDNVPTPTEDVRPAGLGPPEALPLPENARPFVAVENAEQQTRCAARPGKPFYLVENRRSQASTTRRRHQKEQTEISIVRLGIAECQIANGGEPTSFVGDAKLQRCFSVRRRAVLEERTSCLAGRQTAFEGKIVGRATVDRLDGIEIIYRMKPNESDR